MPDTTPTTVNQRFTRLDELAQVFVILVSYNTAGLLQRCIDHLRVASAGLRVSVVIVDNASRDGSVALIKRDFTDCKVIENSVNVGFGRANNQALPLCNAPFVLLLNTDAYVSSGALAECLQHMGKHARCGVLGLRLVNEAGEGNSSVRDFPDAVRSFAVNTGLIRRKPNDLIRARGADFVDCDWVTGCFYMVRQTTIDEVGLFDPRYFLYFEEVDHCRAVHRAGWEVHCLLSCTVVHEGGASARSGGELAISGQLLLAPHTEGELLYFRKHGGLLGLMAALFFGLATDAVQIVKGPMRGKNKQHRHDHVRHARQLVSTAVATRYGQRPTR
jgi:N-acetylglucosaminyl-diphospho-decaprenol L-rhamnosyltransferase